MADRELILYNSRTHTKETFKPLSPEIVNMYVCGPTVYDSAHLGHARAAVVFDLLYRVLRDLKQYKVKYIRNFTDIDDKIIMRANENDEDSSALAERYIQEYVEDMQSLGTLTPSLQPKVTDNIEGILRYIQILIDKEHAYASGGNVYFAVRSFDEYGKLSGRDTESMLAGQRTEEDFNKHDPLDFALWKAVKEGEPSWESPWGLGRPGWHIECSVMSGEYGAKTLDIHGGGRDLLFPHHENETAQSECIHGVPFANFWIHNGFVNIGAEKMSKSSRNFITVRDILDRWPDDVVRFFLLSAHYRSVLEFTWSNLGEAIKQVERFYTQKRIVEDLAKTATGQEENEVLSQLSEQTLQAIQEGLSDDLNTPRCIAAMHDYARGLNRWLDENRKTKSRQRFGTSWQKHVALWQQIGIWTGFFGRPVADFFMELRTKGAQTLGISGSEVERKLAERIAAREEKDWQKADDIRNELAEKGIIFEDTPEGTIWRIDAETLARRLGEQD